jgi:hypothetical protein
VVHIDADVAEKRYADVNDETADLAGQRGWPTLPNLIRCPPPSGSADAMRTCLLSWAGMQRPGPKTVFCVPSKAVEAWLTAATFDNGHALQNGLECNLNVEAQLKALPVAQRIKKTSRDQSLDSRRAPRKAPTRQSCGAVSCRRSRTSTASSAR